MLDSYSIHLYRTATKQAHRIAKRLEGGMARRKKKKGRRKVGRKKRRMRSRIRHRKG
jgi:hypothetical protein